jgi:hypothetical protein
VQVVLPD